MEPTAGEGGVSVIPQGIDMAELTRRVSVAMSEVTGNPARLGADGNIFDDHGGGAMFVKAGALALISMGRPNERLRCPAHTRTRTDCGYIRAIDFVLGRVHFCEAAT
jgi:hypothetical protein